MRSKRTLREMKRPRRHSGVGTFAMPVGYPAFLASIKSRIRRAQISASLAVTQELTEMYWDLGRQIVERQEREGWGSAVIDRLAADLRAAFPGMRGLATRNFQYARSLLPCVFTARNIAKVERPF